MIKPISFFLFYFLFLQTGFSQDSLRTNLSTDLEEIVVTYQADKLTPVTFQNIDLQFLQEKSIGQEPSFLLAQTPSVTNYSDAGSGQGYSYIRLRGIDQTRINITLDGVPLNEPEDQGAYFSNYADIMNSVRKIQIQRGVGTTKNGVASYAGSIQLFSPNLGDPQQTTFGAGYGSFNSYRIFAAHNTGIKNKKALYVRASQIYSDGYKRNAFNNSQSIYISTGLFGDASTWKFNVLAGMQQNGMAWLGVSEEAIKADRRTNGNADQERDKFGQALAQLKNTWQINDVSSLQSSVYYTYLKGNYGFDLNNFIGLPSSEELYNYAFQSHLTGIFSNYTYEKNKLTWTTGLHGNIYNREHVGTEKIIGNLYENTGYKVEYSFFTKANYQINRFNLFADVQYRYVTFDYEGAVDFTKLDWSFINPKAGLSYAANSNLTFYYSIGKTGREPTRNDMFGGNDDLLGDGDNNPILSVIDPESVVDHELGFRYKQEDFNFSMNCYFMDFSNEIVLAGNFGPNGLALTNNVEQSIRTGIELSASYQLNKHITLTNNSSWNHSRIKEQSEKFSPILTPSLIINQEASYQYKNFTIGLTGRYQSESYMDFANSATLDDYFLLDGRMAYTIGDFKIAVFLNNITNAKFYNNGYVDFDGSNKYFVQAPTNFYAAFQYHF